jgi:hypothetical protein
MPEPTGSTKYSRCGTDKNHISNPWKVEIHLDNFWTSVFYTFWTLGFWCGALDFLPCTPGSPRHSFSVSVLPLSSEKCQLTATDCKCFTMFPIVSVCPDHEQLCEWELDTDGSSSTSQASEPPQSVSAMNAMPQFVSIIDLVILNHMHEHVRTRSYQYSSSD